MLQNFEYDRSQVLFTIYEFPISSPYYILLVKPPKLNVLFKHFWEVYIIVHRSLLGN
jgi:hypothetical protein